jgi:capsular exopolysaccharide synthesis family protein
LAPEKLAAEIQPTEVENLSILCSGPRPSNPAELLTSPRLQQVLDWVGERFDHVIIDSPPVLAVTDACILGRAADAVLLVLKADKSDRDNAVRARDTLVSMGCTVLGVAMNDIHSKDAYGYYYYGYGRHKYRRTNYAAYGGTAEDHEAAGPDAAAPEEGDSSRTAA